MNLPAAFQQELLKVQIELDRVRDIVRLQSRFAVRPSADSKISKDAVARPFFFRPGQDKANRHMRSRRG